MTKKLVPGQTVIKVVDTDTGKKFVRSTIYFGNHTMPMVDGKFKSLKDDVYRQFLREFLSSDAGKDYDPPTEEEIKEAALIVANIQRSFIERQKEEAEAKKKQEMAAADPVYLEPKQPKVAKVQNPEPQYEYEDDEDEDEEELPRKGKKAKKEKVKAKITKNDMDQLTLMYKKQANILTVAVIVLTLIVALQMLLNLYLLTR